MNPRQVVVRLWDGLPGKKESRFVGTAFFVAPDTLLTAKHIVKKFPEIYLDGIPDGGKKKIEPDNIKLCGNRDVAILKTDTSYNDLLPFNLVAKELAIP